MSSGFTIAARGFLAAHQSLAKFRWVEASFHFSPHLQGFGLLLPQIGIQLAAVRQVIGDHAIYIRQLKTWIVVCNLVRAVTVEECPDYRIQRDARLSDADHVEIGRASCRER